MRLRCHVMVAIAALVAVAACACSKTSEPPAGSAPGAPAKATVPAVAKAGPAVKVTAAAPAPAAATNVKLPPAWPKDFPLPAGANVTNTSESPGYANLEVATPGAVAGVADWYQATMKEKGWKLDNKDASDEHTSINFSRKGGTASVSITPGDPGKVNLALTWHVVIEE